MSEILFLENLYANFLFIFIRIFFFIAFSPVFSASQNIKLKVGIATAVTIMLMPLIPFDGIPSDSYNLVFFVITESIIGVGMAMILKIAFAVTEVAGHAMSQAGGLSFAVNADPQNGAQVPVIGNFLSILAMLLFLSINGVPISISALSDSYLTLPPGSMPDISVIEGIWKYSSIIFSTAFMVALPVVTAVTMANIAFGVMTRTSPQINILAIGLPISLLITILVVNVSVEHFVVAMMDLFTNTLTFLGSMYGR